MVIEQNKKSRQQDNINQDWLYTPTLHRDQRGGPIVQKIVRISIVRVDARLQPPPAPKASPLPKNCTLISRIRSPLLLCTPRDGLHQQRDGASKDVVSAPW